MLSVLHGAFNDIICLVTSRRYPWIVKVTRYESFYFLIFFFFKFLERELFESSTFGEFSKNVSVGKFGGKKLIYGS